MTSLLLFSLREAGVSGRGSGQSGALSLLYLSPAALHFHRHKTSRRDQHRASVLQLWPHTAFLWLLHQTQDWGVTTLLWRGHRLSFTGSCLSLYSSHSLTFTTFFLVDNYRWVNELYVSCYYPQVGSLRYGLIFQGSFLSTFMYVSNWNWSCCVGCCIVRTVHLYWQST